MMLGRYRLVCLILAFSFQPAGAQDRRLVRQPRAPVSCTVLKAKIRDANGGGLIEADERRADTQRIQEAIDACPQGQAVELADDQDRRAFLTGPLSLRSGVTLLIDRRATLYASRRTSDYDVAPGSCGILTTVSTAGCKALISGIGIADAAIMGEGVIDGRGGSSTLGPGDQAQATWWDMARASGNGLLKHNPRMIDFSDAHDITVSGIYLRNAPGFHLAFRLGHGLTVWGVTLDTPYDAKNSDGIDPMGSSDITIADTYIRTGDDNIAIKADDGQPSSHISILDSHLYWGHGLSIGSGTYPAIASLLVRNVTMDGTRLAAIRIKSGASNGGTVSDIVYDHVCIRNSDRPIEIETAYSDADSGRRDRIPLFRDITLHDVVVSGGGKINVAGYDALHPVELRMTGVLLSDGPQAYHVSARDARARQGPGPVNFVLRGQDVQTSGTGGDAADMGLRGQCDAAFVPFPSRNPLY